MKHLIIPIVLLAALTACTGSVQTKTVTSVAIACDAYQESLSKAADLKKAGKLSANQISVIDRVNKATDVICLPDSPIDPAASAAVVQSAIATIKEIVK